MSLDLVTLAADAVDTAWELTDSVLTACTLYLNPTVAYDATADTTATTWGATKTLKALLYDDAVDQKESDKQVPEAAAAGTTSKSAVVRVSDLEGATINQHAELDDGTNRWRVTKIETPPTNAIVLLSLMR